MHKKIIKIFCRVISIVLIIISLLVIKYEFDSNKQYCQIDKVNKELKGWFWDDWFGGGSSTGSGNNGSSKPVHTHRYSATVIQKGNPDCAEYTITEYTCSCGASYTTSTIKKHSYGLFPRYEGGHPVCTVALKEIYTCTKCGHEKVTTYNVLRIK